MEDIAPNIILTETARAWKKDKMIMLHIDKIYLMQEHSGTFLLLYAVTDDVYLIEDYTKMYLLAL